MRLELVHIVHRLSFNYSVVKFNSSAERAVIDNVLVLVIQITIKFCSLCFHAITKGSKILTSPAKQREHFAGVRSIATSDPMLISCSNILIL